MTSYEFGAPAADMKNSFPSCLVTSLCLVLMSGAIGDIIHFKDGTSLEGKVLPARPGEESEAGASSQAGCQKGDKGAQRVAGILKEIDGDPQSLGV